MKKLMIAAAIVCAGVAAQAASFSWTSADYSYIAKADGTRITASGDYTTLLNGGSIVLAYLGNGEAASWDKAVATSSIGAIKTSNPSGTKGKITGKLEWSAAQSDYVAGDKFAVMYKAADGALSKLVYVDSKGNVGDEISTIYTLASGDDGTTYDAFTFTTAGTSTTVMNNFTTAVPEPTSGLLLLLGIGAMALRRRRA